MKLMALNEVERKFTGFTHKVTIFEADLTAAATTQTIPIFPSSGVVTPGIAVTRTAIRVITPFTGGAVSAMVADLGDAGTVGRYIANGSTDLFTALATNTKTPVISTTAYAYTLKNVTDGGANAQLAVKFTATGDNVVNCTAGEVDIYFNVVDLAGMARPKTS